jgi:hypothetical protein
MNTSDVFPAASQELQGTTGCLESQAVCSLCSYMHGQVVADLEEAQFSACLLGTRAPPPLPGNCCVLLEFAGLPRTWSRSFVHCKHGPRVRPLPVLALPRPPSGSMACPSVKDVPNWYRTHGATAA